MSNYRLLVAFIIALSLPIAALAELNIPVTVVERQGDSRTNQPVTSGIPLPEGVVKDVSKLRLVDGSGKEVPCQFTPSVQWFRDGSVRWVLLDFQYSVPALAMRPLFVRDDAPATPISNPIVVQQDADRITVTTGPLKFAVLKRKFDLINEAWLDSNWSTTQPDATFNDSNRIIAPGKASGPALWSNFPNLPKMRRYAASNDAESQVTVEESGPMRVVIKAVGKHLADDAADADAKLLDYVIRIHAYRGQSMLKVVYSAECKQGATISEFQPVDRWELIVPGQLGKPDELTYRFGTEGTHVSGGFGRNDRAWLVCESSDNYEIGGAAYHHSTEGVLRGKGKSIDPERLGMVDLCGPQHGIMLAVRWFWQNNPKGLIVDRGGAVHAALWPNLGGNRTPTVTGAVGDRKANFFTGMSKTHEMLLYFHSAADVGRVAEMNAFLRTPMLAVCEPSWYCEKTRAFGRLASSDPSLYPADRRWVVSNYDQYFEQNRLAILGHRDFNRGLDAFGMFNFGCTINHVEDSRRDKNGERADPTTVHWDNNYYGFPHALVMQFARTGNLDMLDLAEQSSTHLQDVDILCWSPNAKFIGAPRYSAGLDHVRIYGNGDPVYQSDTYNHYKNQSMFERFCLLGDRRALDMGLLSAGFARTNKTNALSQSRSIGHGIIMLLSAYEITHDTSYLEAASTIIEKTRGFRKSGSGAWQDGIALEAHRMWYEVTGDTKAIETVLGGVDAAMAKRDLAGSILQAIAFAYGQTGDQKYLDAAIKGLVRNCQGKRTSTISFGNNFRNTGFIFWYITNDLPKKEQVPVLNWKK